jgi:hypothetical protein
MYFFASRGVSAYLPFGGYLILVLESLLLSLPIGFAFLVILDIICKTKMTLLAKKTAAWGMLQLLLLAMYAVLIHGFGGRATTWASCFEFIVISSVTVFICVFVYKLQPQTSQNRRLDF